MKNKKRDQNMNHYMELISTQVAHYCEEVVREQERISGPEIAQALYSQILGKMTAIAVYAALTRRPPHVMNHIDMLEYTKSAFGEFKLHAQNAIAFGYQQAMLEYTGKTVEYYCQIKVMPEPLSKTPC